MAATTERTIMASNDGARKSHSSISRRSVLAGGATIAAASLAGCSSSGGCGSSNGSSTSSSGTSQKTTKIHSLMLEGSMFDPVFFYGREQNVWENRGIDLSLEVTGFGKFTRTFSQNLAKGASPLSSLPLAGNLAGDTPVKCFGQTMNFINQCFVAKDSDIQKPSDLKGKVLGVPGRGSSTTRLYIAMWADLYGFDLVNDPAKIVDASTSTLYNFLDQGKEVDAALLFTSSTIKAMANDNLRSIFDPVAEWEKSHGLPPQVTMFGAYNDFLDSDPGVVLDYWKGWTDAVDLFHKEFDTVVNNYGAVGGIDLSSDAEIAAVKQMASNDKLFRTTWNSDWVDTTVELFQLVAKHGGLDSAPGKDQFITTKQLENKA